MKSIRILLISAIADRDLRQISSNLLLSSASSSDSPARSTPISMSVLPPKTFSVSYELHPPADLPEQPEASGSRPRPALPPTSATLTYPVEPRTNVTNSTGRGPATETSAHYTVLGETLRKAQKELNDTLTLWKDAIGDKEKSKEDPGTIGYGRGKAAMMSEEVRGELRAADGIVDGDSEDSDEA